MIIENKINNKISGLTLTFTFTKTLRSLDGGSNEEEEVAIRHVLSSTSCLL